MCLRDIAYHFFGDAYAGGELVFLKDGRWVVYCSEYDFSEITRVDLQDFAGVGTLTGAVYEPVSDSAIVFANGQPVRRLYLRRLSGAGASYPVILSALCSDAGLAGVHYDVSETDIVVDGFVIARSMPIKDAASPLLLAGALHVIERWQTMVLRRHE